MPADTRTRILETASRLFHEQGYAATGVATILREAGVNSGSLYHFFPSKEALLIGVLAWYQTMLGPLIMEPVEAAETDPVERIFVLLAVYRRGLAETDCRLGCPIGNLALEVSDTHPEVRPEIDVNFVRWAAWVERWLDEAGDRLPAATDRGALARFVLTVMEGGLMQARAADDLRPFDQAVALLRDYFDRLCGPAAHPTDSQEVPR